MNKPANKENSILNFIAEAGLLKRVRRSGWWVVGIKDPESVAEHSFRCAAIAYLLAKMEKCAPYKAVMMALFNDIHEARINDLHKMGHRYIDFAKAEKKAFAEQVAGLPGDIRQELSALHNERYSQDTFDGLIARDADILECLVQAKEYKEQGFVQAKEFLNKAPAFLKTKSAKKIWKAARKWPLNDWWLRLAEFER